MDLANFIEKHIAALVDDWAEYAVAISQDDSQLSAEQLRDSAADILLAIAADMREPQSADQQQSKSRGEKSAPDSRFNQVARLHAEDRLSHAFGINHVVAEFRALRATVLRRWQKTSPAGAIAFQEMIRFNEAIDQALAESVRHYAQRTERIRDLFAGVLAHDLRSPLGAIMNSSKVLLHDEGLSAASARALAFVQRGAVRMKQMIDDLLIFTRTRLGDLLPVGFTAQNMGRICSDAVDEVRASYPDARIGQLIVNLLINAVGYGSGQIAVEASSRDGWVTVAVANEGNPIPERALPTLFDPLTRATMPDRSGTAAGIGLGLYICRCIASAHQGTISVVSTAAGTRFTVAIPALPSSPA